MTTTLVFRQWFRAAALVAVLFALFNPLLRAQSATGTITGRVLNEGTGQYLRSAVISVAGTNLSTSSEAGGSFVLTGVPAGAARLSVSYAGLDPAEVSVNVVAGQTVNADVNLTSAAYRPDSGVVQLSKFVVATEREGNAKAIQEQRESLNFKTVMASDAFGDVSEGNIGEFLKLMPGISIDYVEADARSISVGGLDPKYTTVLMDGAPIASAGSSDLGTGRITELEQLSVASIETIELNRTPTPDVSGSALAGVVNLRSKGAFDRKGRSIRFQTSLSANSLDLNSGKTPGPDNKNRYKIQPNATLEFSDVFLEGKLGVLVGYNYSWAFAEQKANTYTWTFDNDPNNNATEIPRLNSFSLRDSPKPTTRRNYNARIDYKFNKDMWAWTRIDYNTYSAQFYSRDLGFTLGGAVTNAPGSTAPANPSVDYSLLSQSAPTGASVSYNQGGGSTNKHGATTTFSSGFSVRRGSFSGEIQGTYSRSTNWYQDIPFGWVWSVNPGSIPNLGLRWNRAAPNDPNMYITQLAGADWRDLRNVPNGFTVTTNDRSGIDEKWNLKSDLKNTLSLLGVPVQFKYGGSINESNRYINRRRSNNLTHLGADRLPNTADDAPALYAEADYRMEWPFGGNINGVTNFDRHKLAKEFGEHPDWFSAVGPTAYLQQDLQQRAIVREQIDALYAQPIFKFGKFDIAPGYRWEHTRGVFNAPAALTDAQTRRALNLPATGTVDTASEAYVRARYGSFRRDAHTDYTTSLKYLHANYRFTRNLQFRSSYNESITRPDLNRLAGTITINNEAGFPPTATIGNPDLKPERARNVYTNLEYYFPKQVGLVSVSWSRRDLKDLIRTTTIDIPPDGEFDGDPQWAGWRLSTVDNVAKAHNSSWEFTYRQQLSVLPWEFARNFTVWANHTRLFYDDYDNFRRPLKMANGGVDFRYRRFLASWKTNWTGYVRTGAVPANGWAAYTRERLFHDIQLNYTLWRNYTLTLTGRNVLHSQQLQTYAGGRQDIMTRYLDIGSIWTLGVKGQF